METASHMGRFVTAFVRLMEAGRGIPTVPKALNEERIKLFSGLTDAEVDSLERGHPLPESDLSRLAERSGVPPESCRHSIDSFLIWRHKCLAGK